MNDGPSSRIDFSFLPVKGMMAERIRDFDWASHPLGVPEKWPQSLKVAVRIMLTSRYAMWMGWGGELFFFCNDAYAPTLGLKRDNALGRPARKVWAEIWDDVGPRAESVVSSGEATWDESLLLFLERSGFSEETYHTFSYSPLPDDSGGIGGMLCVVTEETERVISERRLAMLRELGADLATTQTEPELFSAVKARLAANPADVPFALVYLVDDDGRTACVASRFRIAADSKLAPENIALDDGAAFWPLADVRACGRSRVVPLSRTHEAPLPESPWGGLPREAVVLPIAQQGQECPAGFLIAGLNPYRPFDAAYSGFLDLLVGQIAAGLASARAYQAERRRVEALAEIDRAKTAFFSNVSHEFRTPLTLLLSPLEEIVNRAPGEVIEANRELASVAHRNALRLLKLVNTLLDFSRIEAGRMNARFEPVDLGTFTAELASAFRSAMDKAGLIFVIESSPLSRPVEVDREMWEKIVFNLLSNAFKFTLDGSVSVRLRETDDGSVELEVADTGVGIPEAAVPRLFERFFRVENSRGRTHEGSGIGLALVNELVKLHGGEMKAQSVEGQGSTFTVSLRRGRANAVMPSADGAGEMTRVRHADSHLAEVFRWLPDDGAMITDDSGGHDKRLIATVPDQSARDLDWAASGGTSGEVRPRIVLADDNSDMRQYIARLLAPRFEVVAVPDGEAALEEVRRHRPDIVVSDVMMPRLDGFGLLHALRRDESLRTLPVILLSARAGEEACVEAVQQGADDYLVKPFSARELVARLETHLRLANFRSEAGETLRRSEERAKASERELRFVADSIPLFVVHCDADLRLRFANMAFAKRFGFHPSEVIGRRLPDILGERVFAACREEIAGVLHGTANDWEKQVCFEDAGPRWIHANCVPDASADGTVRGFIGVIEDVTGRKEIEAEVIKSRKFLASTLDALSSHIAVLDAKGTIIEVNATWRRFAELNGMTHASHGVGMNYLHVLEGSPDGDCEELESARGLRAVMQGELSCFKLEYPCHSPAEKRWFLMKATPFSADGEVRVVVAHDDITDRVLALEAIRRAKESAELASRTKDRFLAVLSHELRTPLTPVLLAMSVLEKDPALPTHLLEEVAMMKRNIALETTLIDDLLDLNRIASGKLKLDIAPVDLNEAVCHVCRMCQADKEDERFRLSLDPEVGAVAADSARLQQMLWNVVKNAMKFTPPTGEIRISTRKLEDSILEVRVTDTGIGITPEALPRIFDAFEQGDAEVTRQFGGMGLGLAICKALSALHHGRIRGESEGPGRGATFVIELPAACDAPAAHLEGMRSDQTALPPLRLLLVEDHADTARTLSKLLERAGFSIRVAGDVAGAKREIDADDFDVIVSDLGLPDGSGCEVMIHARERSPHVRGIVMSGYGMDEDAERSLSAGFSEHLTKPVEFATLQKAIARVAGG